MRSHANLYLSGPFGAGKTSLAIERVRWLLGRGARGDDILVLVPHPVNAEPFARDFASAESAAGAPVRIATTAQLAREAVELRWPELRASAGIGATREPVFLNIEGAQYYMGHLVDDALRRGRFEGIALSRQQIILQVLNTMSHAAHAGLSLDAAWDRLLAARAETDAVRQAAIEDARALSHDFRAICLAEALVDHSLLMELTGGWLLAAGHAFPRHACRHLIADNLEEENAVGHSLVRALMPQVESALLCADEDGGMRSLLGADPAGGYALAELCDERLRLPRSQVMSEGIAAVERRLWATLDESSAPAAEDATAGAGAALAVLLDSRERLFRFFPQMVAAAAGEVARLVQREGVAPGRIVIVAPAISDALRFSLERALARHEIALTTHRPSRALADEPAARALITLVRLAHPQWGSVPSPTDIQQALLRVIHGLDPVRASLLAQGGALRPYDALSHSVRRRVPEHLAARYERLRAWLDAYRSDTAVPLDLFLARLFEEVLSGPEFAFHDNADAVRAANQMVESARALRQSLEPTLVGETERLDLGDEYLRLVESGALGALYVPAWSLPADAVLLAPPAAFLLRNEAVEVQVWLDASSPAWSVRIEQALTHSGVLTQGWPAGKPWTAADEEAARSESLRRTLVGLLRRTHRRVVVVACEYSESGYEQRGPLLPLLRDVL